MSIYSEHRALIEAAGEAALKTLKEMQLGRFTNSVPTAYREGAERQLQAALDAYAKGKMNPSEPNLIAPLPDAQREIFGPIYFDTYNAVAALQCLSQSESVGDRLWTRNSELILTLVNYGYTSCTPEEIKKYAGHSPDLGKVSAPIKDFLTLHEQRLIDFLTSIADDKGKAKTDIQDYWRRTGEPRFITKILSVDKTFSAKLKSGPENAPDLSPETIPEGKDHIAIFFAPENPDNTGIYMQKRSIQALQNRLDHCNIPRETPLQRRGNNTMTSPAERVRPAERIAYFGHYPVIVCDAYAMVPTVLRNEGYLTPDEANALETKIRSMIAARPIAR